MGKRDEKYVRMTTAPVQKLICGYAVPAIISQFVTNIYNVADSFFVGRLDTQSTAALGVVFSYMALIQACSFFFGQGSGNFISRALGARKGEEAERMASTGFFSAIIFGVTVALLCGIFIHPALDLFGATPTVMPSAIKYFRWILVGTPFIVGSFVLNNQMRFQGNASVAMWGILSGALLNIALDPLLIFVAGLGVEGAGMATAISQAASFCLMIRMCGRNGGIVIKPRQFTPSVHSYKEIAAGGLPSLARQGLMALATMVLNNCAGVYGDEALAAFSIVGRVMHLAACVAIGFGQGFQPVCGYNYGAKMYDRLRQAIKFCVIVATSYCVLFAIVGYAWAPGIVQLFRADDPEVIRLGTLSMRAQCLMFPVVGFITITNMYLQSSRQTAPALMLAIARHGLFLIPCILVGSLFGFNGIVASQPISDFLSFLLAVPLCLSAIRRMK